MSVIIKSTPHGRRAFPITTKEAEHMVAQGKAQRIKAFFYRQLIEDGAAHDVSAELEIPETEIETDENADAAPRRGRPRKS